MHTFLENTNIDTEHIKKKTKMKEKKRKKKTTLFHYRKEIFEAHIQIQYVKGVNVCMGLGYWIMAFLYAESVSKSN